MDIEGLFNMTKPELRKFIKSELTAHSFELKHWSRDICAQILKSDIYKKCPIVLAYSPLPDEVDITPVIHDALARGKKVFLPVIRPGATYMEFFPYTENTKITEGSFGILEPEIKRETAFEVTDVFQTLVLVPGRAFSIDGSRLGRGKGFYDHFFHGHTANIHLAGVCFPCQVVEEVPTDENDVPMEFLF